ncbi:FruA-associating protein, FapA [Myxococcus sp. CA051A]|uniref:FruA-associating protein, FapA n=1 Tax=unclassified Myxococcus TaxID=2648731 RepID=UPI00157A2DBA|nr:MULTISPECIES: FruA-associating protein, FapA [unclassified Myxococcus]NTX07646.1 FruA-associating protein, FapA [Myxococcus sp. CA040A]NTX10685.1 FruA-associating protein, FapA [Myxococcus sp. CA056]NTX41369.1 FruA-associating protein, FapA [Myxococcus sp. CA033]NTX50693.1 FruA-associating protein, FapA [Myxococcus sp. CA039A]NTX66020.1 FruA-associating protein, FapA [Myxococcus sp. CA051A]
MTTTLEHAGYNKMTVLYPEEHELLTPGQSLKDPHAAAKLRLQASLWLSRAQRELHDAIFLRDGSDESMDRYCGARAELDSAEAWALLVAKALIQPD